MRNSFAFGTVAAALFALPLLTVTPAHAGISACGNIDVSAQGSCTAEVSDTCAVDCSPLKVDVACSAQLEASCEGSCPKVPEVSCTGSCDTTCEAKCTVKPADFDCEANCKGDASASCDSQCSANADKAKCTASCQATFSAQCHANCTGTPATADCKAKCQGSCQGSCTAQTTLQCQVMCQSSGYATCEAKLEGGCKADCQDPKGALFCDGQYVDHNGTVDECIAAIKAALPSVHIDVSAQSSGSCDSTTSTCMGQASGSASCAFSPRRVGGGGLAGAFALFAALGAVCLRRRKSH
jgi:Tfp pilus assembly protein PilW